MARLAGVRGCGRNSMEAASQSHPKLGLWSLWAMQFWNVLLNAGRGAHLFIFSPWRLGECLAS